MRHDTRSFSLLVALGCLLAAGCDSTTEPVAPMPSALVGTWVGDTLRHTPRGMTAFVLRVAQSGRFEWAVRTSGLYPGQAVDELTSMSRLVGSLTAEDTRLDFRSDSIYASTGTPPMETAEKAPTGRGLGGGTGPFDEATYSIANDVLTIRYVSYPNDSPAPSSRRFIRVR